MKKTIDNYTVIIGCGRLGASIANNLSDEGKDILIIDINKDAFRKLSSSYGGLTIAGDATDIDILKEASVDRASSVIVVTNNDNVNIMVSQLVKELFGCKKVIARLYNPDYECVYREFEIEIVCPSVLSANVIVNHLENIKEVSK